MHAKQYTIDLSINGVYAFQVCFHPLLSLSLLCRLYSMTDAER